MLILLTAFHTLHIILVEFNRFPDRSRPVAFFQDFSVLENAIIKFQDFPGFPGHVRTLYIFPDCINISASGQWIFFKFLVTAKINRMRVQTNFLKIL